MNPPLRFAQHQLEAGVVFLDVGFLDVQPNLQFGKVRRCEIVDSF
jgi:hypothetical protein